jgi:iron complex transport system substrate-binding protein
MRTTHKRLLVLLAIPALLLSSAVTGTLTVAAASSKTAAAFPVTIKAADGTFTLHSRPKAIVSLSPTSTEILFAIGAGSQVRAVDSYSNYPPNAPITKLSAYTPNVEAIAKYKPDLVVVATDSASFNSQMKALKIPVIYFSAASNLSQAYSEYLALGKATGHVAGAKAEIARVKAKISHIVSSTPKATAGSTYYYELDPTYYSVTSSTFVGQLLGLLGLKSIADSATGVASSGGYPQLNAEFILKANPSFIFLADTVCCKASSATVGARPGWSALSAVQNGHVVGLNDDIASRWGPRVTVLLQDVANALKASKVAPTS